MTAKRQPKLVFLAAPIMDQLEDGRWISTMQDAAREGPQLGVYLLTGVLERNGYDVDILDWVAFPDRPIVEVVEKIAGYDVALFSCNSMNWAVVRAVAIQVKKKNPEVRMVVGGPHATHYPESVAAAGVFDCYYRGEADLNICRVVDLMLGKSVGIIPGLGFPEADVTPEINQELDLTKVDWRPAYHRLPKGRYKTINIETSRGCKFQCTFCSITSKRNWRGYSAETAIEQIEYAYGYADRTLSKRINIVDNTFTTDRSRISQITSQLDRKRFADGLIFDATIVDARQRKVMEELAPFTHSFLVGAEVASKEDARRIRKAATPGLIEDAARVLAEIGLANRAVFSFILGFPWHTVGNCLTTLKFVKDLIIQYNIRSFLQWYWPMPGSVIWNELQKEGRISLEMIDEPGFYRSHEWFFPVRKLTNDEVKEIDEKVSLVMSLLKFTNHSSVDSSLRYATPLNFRARKVLRNPFP